MQFCVRDIQPGIAAKASPYLCERIIRLWKEGKTIINIVSIVETGGHKITRQTVSKWNFRWEGQSPSQRQNRSMEIRAQRMTRAKSIQYIEHTYVLLAKITT